MDFIFIALNSSPDYSAPPPSFHSAHRTLEGAAFALYPNNGIGYFKQSPTNEFLWNGPDGFGMIRLEKIED